MLVGLLKQLKLSKIKKKNDTEFKKSMLEGFIRQNFQYYFTLNDY